MHLKLSSVAEENDEFLQLVKDIFDGLADLGNAGSHPIDIFPFCKYVAYLVAYPFNFK